jgi:hypothetical protein
LRGDNSQSGGADNGPLDYSNRTAKVLGIVACSLCAARPDRMTASPFLHAPDSGGRAMASDEHWEASPRRFGRFGLASLFVLMTAIAVAIAIGMELSKSEVTAYIQIRRSLADAGWPRPWDHEPSREGFDLFRRSQIELMRSKSLLVRMLRNPSVSKTTFLDRVSDPVEWLQDNLQFDFPNDAELLRIRLRTHEPDDGVKIMNAVVDTYFKEVVERGVQERNKAEQKLKVMSDEFTEALIREKKEVVKLETSLGAEAAARSAELDVHRAKIRQDEERLNEVTRQLYRLQLEKQAPQRVLKLDEATVSK